MGKNLPRRCKGESTSPRFTISHQSLKLGMKGGSTGSLAAIALSVPEAPENRVLILIFGLLLELGRVLKYTKVILVKKILTLAQRRGADMVYESVQKPSSWSPTLHKSKSSWTPQPTPVQTKPVPVPSSGQQVSSISPVASDWMSRDPVLQRLSLQETTVQPKCSKCEQEESVQLAENGQKSEGKSVQQLALDGFGGSPTSLPHLHQIQQSFGQDLSHVQAYIGGSAAAASDQLRAHAYTSGNKIAFKEQPSLQLAAHEAAHVVQQASGGVQLASGIGQVGDQYEQHADAVAAEVVAGKSAAPLLAEYTRSPSPDKSSQGRIQKRGLTGQEQNFMTRLEEFSAEAKTETARYSGPKFAENVRAAKQDLVKQIGAVPRGTSDPDHLMAALWSLHIWATAPSSYAKAVAIPNHGMNVRSFGADTYKCNRFVGDAYAKGAKAGYAVHGRGGSFPTGKPGFLDPRPGYPVGANELASPDAPTGSLTHLPLTRNPQIGDIISFPSTGIAHTGINLGRNVYISARNSLARPVWGMQPEDGVQITKIPQQEHRFRTFQRPQRPRPLICNPRNQQCPVP
jgi:hypothetical protein